MSIENTTADAPLPARSAPGTALPRGWQLWRRQIRAIVQVELRKQLLGKRSLIIYLMAAIPVFISCVLLLARAITGENLFEQVVHARQFFAILYQTLVLRGILFFGCAWVFTNLFRGEVLDRSLHYYFLSPVRREVLVVAKYLSGLALMVIVLCTMVTVSYLLLYPPFGVGRAVEDLVRGAGFSQLLSYLGTTILACLGYGSLFLIAGVLFKNPILPALVVLLWEGINFILPPLFKKISVIHYVRGLLPIPPTEGPFAVIAKSPSVTVSILGLLVFSGVALVIAAIVVRRMQIRYSED